MSQENVEIVQRSVDALIRGDWDAAWAEFDPGVKWEESRSLGPDAGVYTGLDSAREAARGWTEMWSDYQFEVDDFIDAGDAVVVLGLEHGEGRSGVTVRRELGVVHTVRGGKIVHSRLFGSWSEALEDAGLQDKRAS